MRVDSLLRMVQGRPRGARAHPSLLIITLSALLVVGCSTPRSTMQAASKADDPWAVYTRSIYDAAVLDPENIHPLHALPAGPDSAVVVTWTTTTTADRFYPIGKLPPLAVDVWVTLSPQVRDRCKTYPDDPAALRLRLQQLLGLPPNVEERTFVVMAAATSDIFRPCMDPDPTTRQCSVSFPDNVDAQHRDWMAYQMLGRYQVPPAGYPWTRLGYTYDWNPETSKFGASEYIVRKGATVRVLDTVLTVDYCHAE